MKRTITVAALFFAVTATAADREGRWGCILKNIGTATTPQASNAILSACNAQSPLQLKPEAAALDGLNLDQFITGRHFHQTDRESAFDPAIHVAPPKRRQIFGSITPSECIIENSKNAQNARASNAIKEACELLY